MMVTTHSYNVFYEACGCQAVLTSGAGRDGGLPFRLHLCSIRFASHQ